jgi:hypothetical protein
MKKLFSIGIGLMAGALAMVSCDKQDAAKPAGSQTANAVAHKNFATEGKVFENWDKKCEKEGGSCLDEVIIRPHVRDELVRIISFVTDGNKGSLQTEFVAQRDLLSEVFPTALIDGVINGSYALTYRASPAINRNWFVFSAGSTVVNYVATPIN